MESRPRSIPLASGSGAILGEKAVFIVHFDQILARHKPDNPVP